MCAEMVLFNIAVRHRTDVGEESGRRDSSGEERRSE